MGKENGHVLSFVLGLILLMTFLGLASISLARQQAFISRLNRQNANSYHLARSGAEKMVDSINKEIAIELPRLMKEAYQQLQDQLLEDCFSYQFADEDNLDPYSGKYVGIGHSHQYKLILRDLVYDHLCHTFLGKGQANISYEAYSDVKNNIPFIISTKLHTKLSSGLEDDLAKTIRNLPSHGFAVEVEARAKEGAKTSLAKARVLGVIDLFQSSAKDHLLEEYAWRLEDSPYRPIAFEDLQWDVFHQAYKWSYNNPLEVVSQTRVIDLSEFAEMPTVIICMNSEASITLEGHDVFNGIIISLGDLYIPDEIVINGWVLVESAALGDHVTINHDPEIAFKIRIMDKSLERKLYDCLSLTNYQGLTDLAGQGQGDPHEIMNIIFGEKDKRKIMLSNRSIISSDQGGIKAKMKELRRL